jgi:hypothetical protein
MDVSSTPTVTPSDGRAHAVDSVWGRDGFGFDDLLDVVNPLQHLPGVAQVYRHVTGDEIGMLPRIAGGLLFGGPLGAAAATLTAGIEAGTGKTPAQHALAALQGDAAAPAPTPTPAQVAKAYAPPRAPTPPAGVPAAPPAAGEADPTTRAGEWAPPISGASARLLAELERAATATG